MKNLYIFDVDGVLTDRSMPVDAKFKEWFMGWAKNENVQVCYNTGSNREKTEKQIGKDMLDLAPISFHCLGNSIWIDGRETVINEFQLTQEEISWLENEVQVSPFPIKTGNHIELRRGSVNFSIVGRNANNEQRQLYKEYDTDKQERLDVLMRFLEKFTHFDAFIGGDISIDICVRGAHKGLSFNFINPFAYENVYAFGDKYMQYGVDHPFTYYGPKNYKFFPIDNGFTQTFVTINNL
jgi:phosphomannomutase